MYVSRGTKAAFVHIPKTGGTAIKRGLLRRVGCRRVGDKHGPVSQLPAECAGYFVFAIVRNPYRRLASQYRFRRLCDRSGGGFSEAYPSLHDFLLALTGELGIRLGAHPLCQSEFIDERVTCFRFEAFNDAVGAVCERLRIPYQPILPEPANHALGAYPWRDEMTPEAVEIINDVCRRDFEAFGYDPLTWPQMMEAA